MAYTFVRKLGARGENSLRIVFYFSLFSTLLTLPFFLVSPVQLTGHQLLMLLLCGCSACVGQFGITQAYLLAPAKEISVYDYSQDTSLLQALATYSSGRSRMAGAWWAIYSSAVRAWECSSTTSAEMLNTTANNTRRAHCG